MQVIEAVIITGIRMPVSNIRTKWKQNDIRWADQRFYFIFPFITVRFEMGIFNIAEIPVPPAVRSQFPAIVTETLGNSRSSLAVFLIGRGIALGRSRAVA